eukprot:gnl/TRDRNA2_/TRDRNA2_44868_c0_seq1.p1 gnl/TRDRNA2_/TRDRNA2_44868_c0~~gnl/TRDRNA2_/TRDRNA2_44868_c0_seq1.p1  ORF type:complete len:354 (+),score=45.74 gnl/TRDRNA2_/TRDRNA2_44868_c0_seq1:3-1064(+)
MWARDFRRVHAWLTISVQLTASYRWWGEMCGHRQMQMAITRFERLSRRIALSQLMSGHRAEEAIAQGRVNVDGKVVSSNFKVFAEARVFVDNIEVPPPMPWPKLWAMHKPRKVLCTSDPEELQPAEEVGEEPKPGTVVTLRSFMRNWTARELYRQGSAQSVGLEEECLSDKHFVIACGLPYGADGLVLLTNDGIFAETLTRPESLILSTYDVRVAGSPNVEMLHKWRNGARARGIDFGQVFASITKRTSAATRMRLRYVETPERPIELLLESAKLRVNRLRRHGFGPYIVTDLPRESCTVQVPIHKGISHLCPQADMRQVLVPAAGGIVNEQGRMRNVGLDNSAIPGLDGSDN